MTYFAKVEDAKAEVMQTLNNMRVAAAIATSNAVIIGTPVDTGRARANWQPSVNTPATGEANTSADVSAEFSNSDINDVLYLANNLPYIEPLEQGHSKQQPLGWVRTAVAAGQSSLDAAISKVNK